MSPFTLGHWYIVVVNEVAFHFPMDHSGPTEKVQALHRFPNMADAAFGNDFCDRFRGSGGSFLYVNLTLCVSDAL